MTTKSKPIPVNPKLPAAFSDTANDARPASHQKWWNVPYVETVEAPFIDPEDKAAWLKAWPSGVRYDVRCLDGGAWDRPTLWGMFKTLEEAEACARSGHAAWREVA